MMKNEYQGEIMKKRLTAILLACVMAFSFVPAAYAGSGENDAAAETKQGWDGGSYYRDGIAVNGLQEIDGKEYYFAGQKVVKKKIVYKIGDAYYAINKKGAVKQYSGVEAQAAERLCALYKKDIPALNAKKTEKLFRKAFLWCAKSCVDDNYKGVAKTGDYKKYAVQGFARRKGDCKTQASMLAVMAGLLGYKKVKFVHGLVPTISGFRTHAWITLKNGKKTFVTVGRFSAEKGHARLISAYERFHKEHPETSLIIVGGHGDLWNRTVKQVQDSECREDIFLVRYMSNPYPLMKLCDYFAFSSIYEGFGLVLAEADILGLPCFSPDLPGPRGFMQKYGGLLVEDSEDGIYTGFCTCINGEVPKQLKIDYEAYNQNAVAQFESML